ncbi:MAG: PPC domain-containing DNA-binding protein [Bacillota bacterium]
MKLTDDRFQGFNNYETGQVLKGRLPRGEDLLETLTDLVKDANIRSGHVKVLGALKNAKIGYFNQDEKKYYYHELDSGVEIAHCQGNISLLDGEPFIHAHIIVTDSEGRAYGGHLAEGSKIYVAETIIQELIGEPQIRVEDPESTLSLWEV